MNHISMQRKQSLQSDTLVSVSDMIDAGNDGSDTPLSTSKPRRSHVEKVTHIVALPVLAALLAACAPVEQVEQVEQGRLDQVEAVASAVVEKAFMQPLRGNIEGAKKQLDEAKKLATTSKDDEVVSALDDELNDIEGIMSIAEEESNPAAKVALADEVEKRLEDLEAKLDAFSSSKAPLPLARFYRQIRFNFLNLDAVESSQEGRDEYVKLLTEYFNGLPYGPPEKRKVVGEPDENGNPKGYTFTVEDLAYGIPEDNKDNNDKPGLKQMQVRIAEITEEVKWFTGDNFEITGVPVTTDRPAGGPIEFWQADVDYTSVSGTGYTAGGGPDVHVDVECTETHTFLPKTRAKQQDAHTYLYSPVTGDVTKEEGPEVEIILTSNEMAAEGGCKISPRHRTWHLMVVLREGGLVAAEYHTLVAKKDRPDEAIPERGRLTEKGLPACPPWTSGDGQEASKGFIDKLRKDGWGGCAA